MKVLLINPPSDHELKGNNPAIIDEERGFNPPLGLLYVAAYMEAQGRHEVIVLDTQVEGITYDLLPERIAHIGPDIVGITAMTFTLLDVVKTTALVKQVDPNITVVLGGPHPHIYPQETIQMPNVDLVVMGEGERVFSDLVDALDRGTSLEGIPGLVFQKGDQIRQTAANPLIDNLDALPFPARHLTPFEKYSSLLAKRSPITTMFTSRGCPFRCAFCDRPNLGKRFRARSAHNVVDEMEACVNAGIHEFLVYDDTFSVQRQRVLDICDELLRRALPIGWDIRARVDTVDEEMLSRLKAAGCERIHYGVEAGTERILKVLNKGITLQQAQNAFRMTRRAGIETLAYFMIGAPSETREEIRETLEFAKRLRPDFVHITILTPFPATQIYRDGLSQGILEHDIWQSFAQNPCEGFQPPYWEEILSREELIELLSQAYRTFYTRPSYILKELIQVRSIEELRRKVIAGIKLLKM